MKHLSFLILLFSLALPAAFASPDPAASYSVRTIVLVDGGYRIELGRLYLTGRYTAEGASSFDPRNFFTDAELPQALGHRLVPADESLASNNTGFWQFGSQRFGTKNGAALFKPVSPVSESGRLVNISTRKVIEGRGLMITGFVTSGAKTLVIRAVGPGMAALGVPNVMPNPKLSLYRGNEKIAENDDWAAADAGAFAAVGAFSLTPGSMDAALVTTVSGGAYTVHVADVNGVSGDVLVEVYELN